MHMNGPWRRGQKDNLRIYGPDRQGEHSGLIATVHRDSCMDVIIAAPTLLNMLKWCVNHDGECLADHPELLEAARAAIAELES